MHCFVMGFLKELDKNSTAMTTGCPLLSSFRAEQPAAMGVYVIFSIDTQSREISRADVAQWEMGRYPSQRTTE